MARSPRYWAALGIVVAWAAALGWLALRRTGQSDASLIASQASLRLAPGEAWFRVMAGDVQIGYAGITLDTLENGRYRIREQSLLELPGDTALIRTIRSTEYFLGPGLGVDSLVSTYVRPGFRTGFHVAGTRTGWDISDPAAGSTLRGRLELPEGTQPTPMAPVPVRIVPLRLALVGALSTGAERTLPVAAGWPPAAWSTSVATTEDSVTVYADSSDIDAATGAWVPVTWDTTAARRLVLDTPAGPVRLVLDPRGTVISAEHPFGVRWVREEFNVARFNFRNALDQLEAGIRAQLPPVRRARAAERVGATDQGPTAYSVTRRNGGSIPVSLMMPLSTGRQRYTRGMLVVSERGSVAGRPSRAVPADPLIQVDDSAVAALADAMGDLVAPTGFGRLAQALAREVTLDTTPDAAIDAAGAVRTGRASPEGLARLMAAVLLRHDFSARLAIGVRPLADTLLTATWVEAVHRSFGEWLAIDPLSGRLMSTEWIRLSHAGTAAPDELLPLVADVRFTPVDAQATEGATP